MAQASEFNRFGWIASYAAPVSTGDYGEYRALQPYLRAVDPEERRGLRAAESSRFRLCGAPAGAFRHYVEKAFRLYNLGRQGGAYYGNLNPSALVTTTQSAQALRQVFDAYTALYAFGLSLAAILALGFLIIRPPAEASGMLPILFLATVSLALILLGEIRWRFHFLRVVYPAHLCRVRHRPALANPDRHRRDRRWVAAVAGPGLRARTARYRVWHGPSSVMVRRRVVSSPPRVRGTSGAPTYRAVERHRRPVGKERDPVAP